MDKKNSLPNYFLPSNLHRYVTSVQDWFSGFASFVSPVNTPIQQISKESIEDILSSKLSDSQNQMALLLSSLEERKALGDTAVSQLEDIIRKFKENLNPLLNLSMANINNSASINEMMLKLQQEISACEKEILKERLSIFHDCLQIKKALLYSKEKLEDRVRIYRLFREL